MPRQHRPLPAASGGETGNIQSPRIQRLGCWPATRSVQDRFGPNLSGTGPSVLSSPVLEVVACEGKFACISTCTSRMHESLSTSARSLPHMLIRIPPSISICKKSLCLRYRIEIDSETIKFVPKCDCSRASSKLVVDDDEEEGALRFLL